LIVIDVGCHRNTPSDHRRIVLGKTIIKKGASKCLIRSETAENLSKLGAFVSTAGKD
jgi:hypothetical protein